MLASASWLELHARVLYLHDHHGRLVSNSAPDLQPAPRLYIGRGAGGGLWRVRHDLPPDLQHELARAMREVVFPASLDDPFEPPAGIARLLEQHAPIRSRWRGLARGFPAMLPVSTRAARLTPAHADALLPHFPEYAADWPDWQPCAVVIERGAVIALCCSSRLTAFGAEAGLETAAEHRGRGLAGEAVAAWAAAVRDQGKTPLYSFAHDNTASRRVADKLGLIPYAEDFSFD